MTSSTAVTRSELDVKRVRDDFPILRTLVHGKPLVYLDNAATTQKPQVVLDRLARYYTHENANVHRGVHLLSERATDAYEEARKTAARFLHAADPAQDVQRLAMGMGVPGRSCARREGHADHPDTRGG